MLAALALGSALATPAHADDDPLWPVERGLQGHEQLQLRTALAPQLSELLTLFRSGQTQQACSDATTLRSTYSEPRQQWDLNFIPVWRALAICSEASGDAQSAQFALTRSLDIGEQQIQIGRAFYTDTALERLFSFIRPDEDLIYAFAATHPERPSATELAFVTALRRKARLFDEEAERDEQFSRAPAEARADLATAFRNFAIAAFRRETGGANDLSGAQQAVDIAEHAILNTTATNILLSAPFLEPARTSPEQSAALSVNFQSDYIDYIWYRPFDFGAQGKAPAWQAPRYLALVLRLDHDILAHQIVPIGDAAQIDQVAHALSVAAANPGRSANRAADAAWNAIMAPVAEAAGFAANPFLRTLHIVPDGALDLVPFYALHSARGYVVDQWTLIMHDSMRDLAASLAAPARSSAGAQPAALIGGVDYAHTLDGTEIHSTFPALPGTKREIDAIASLLGQSRTLTGSSATAAQFLGLQRPALLHVATHGIFLPGYVAGRDPDLVQIPDGPGGNAPGFDTAAEGMNRAVLAFAGNGTDSGLVTAFDLEQMDLTGNRLLVLSACETDRGDYVNGQGILGLREAARVAGASAIVTSLWALADANTQALMQDFYVDLARGQSIAEALRLAMLARKSVQAHPVFWAPFVAYGAAAGAGLKDLVSTNPGPTDDEVFHTVKDHNDLVRRMWPFTSMPPPEPQLLSIANIACTAAPAGGWICRYDATSDAGVASATAHLLPDGAVWKLAE